MGMALDEPKQDDQVIDFGAYRFLMAPDVAEMARQLGGVSVDYVDEPERRGYTVKMGRGCGDCSC